MNSNIPTDVVLYGTSWCVHCKEARHTLTSNGIKYTYIDVSKYPSIRNWLQVRNLCRNNFKIS